MDEPEQHAAPPVPSPQVGEVQQYGVEGPYGVPSSGPGAGPEALPDGGPDDGGPDDGSLRDEGPRPLGVRIEPTGHAPVDGQLRRLEDADHLAVSGHLEVYEDVHRGLRDTLTALDRHDPRS